MRQYKKETFTTPTLATLPFAIENRQIVRIGINFDNKTRNIDRCLVG